VTTQQFTALTSALALSAAFLTLALTYLLAHRDRVRENRYATLEFWLSLSDRRRELGMRMQKLGGEIGSRANLVKENLEDSDMQRDMGRLLADLEFVSAGVNMGAIDGELLARMSGSYLCNIYSDCEPFISLRRQKQDAAYIELERFVNGLRAKGYGRK
jgi:hypothetical protein